jgi:formylglycine-generating enzyme required for sulfatase activity
MGSLAGAADERPLARVRIEKPFWIGKFEITNAEYALFDATHDSGIISMHNKDQSQRGYPVNNPKQPVVRIAWREAMAFCDWLSKLTGEKFTLPTEAQWEYACRAGAGTPFSFGDLDTDFSTFANLGDKMLRSLAVQGFPPRVVENADPVLDWVPKDDRFYDKNLVTADVGSFKPNAWGLADMHGNAAEWTRTSYQPYPYSAADGRDSVTPEGGKVARGGSWFDRPKRCTSSFRLAYPAWQGVYNVGFRVISESDPKATPVVRAK